MLIEEGLLNRPMSPCDPGKFGDEQAMSPTLPNFGLRHYGDTMMKCWGVLAGVIGTAAVLTPQVTVAQPTGQSATHVVLLDGEVTLCARGESDQAGECAVVAGACTAMTVTEFGDIVEHTSEQEKSELIGRHFEHISSQESLLPEFQAPTGACPVFAQINPNQPPGGVGPAALGALGASAAGLGIVTVRGITAPDEPISP